MTRQIAIVGASAAGLQAARLIRHGQPDSRVTVFEGMERLEPIPRSLIVTHAMREQLGAVGEPAIVNEIHRFELFADGKVAEVPLQRPDLIIERARLIESLAADAERAGVELRFDHRLESMRPEDAGVTLAFRNGAGEVRADAVVGADGAFSTVAREAGWPDVPRVPLVQAIVDLPAGMPRDVARVWFVPDDTPYFYWLIPESGGRGALGIIGTRKAETRELLERFVARRGFEVLEFQGGCIPEYSGWVPVHRKLGDADVYLAGDAAAQVKVTTVGGIVDGIWGATGVAEAILDGGSPRRSTLRSLRRELDLHLLIRRALHHFDEDDYRTLLDFLDGGAKRTLARFSRDETVRLMAHLLVRRPRFLLLGARGLLTTWRRPLPALRSRTPDTS